MRSLFLIIVSFASFSISAQINHCVVDRYGDAPVFDSLDIEREVLTYSIEERWPSTDIDTLKMEVFKPSSSVDPLAERPFILLIHGGSFLEGNRTDMNYMCMEFARRGYVAATMDYRLGWDCTPTNAYCIGCAPQALKLKTAVYRAVQDSRAALRYVVTNSSSLGIDTAALFIQGTSAGSITALHTTFWDQTEADDFCATCTTDLGALDDSGLAPVVPFSIKAVVNNCGAVNTLDILDGSSIPVISFHDQVDCIVPNDGGTVINCFGCTGFFYVSGSQYIRNRLNTNGVCNSMNEKPGILPEHCSYPVNAIIGKASCFLKSILCNSCTSDNTTTIWNIPDCSAGTTSVGLPTLKLDNVRVFPNPTKGEISIRTYSEEPLRVQLISSDGRMIKTFSDVQNDHSLELDELSSGVYTVKISQTNGEFVLRKIVLQH